MIARAIVRVLGIAIVVVLALVMTMVVGIVAEILRVRVIVIANGVAK